MSNKKKKYAYFVSVLLAILAVKATTASETIRSLNLIIKCTPPEPGIYTLGWGTSRLHIPQNGKPYTTFRMERHFVEGNICQSADNIGVVVIDKEGQVWSYFPEN